MEWLFFGMFSIEELMLGLVMQFILRGVFVFKGYKCLILYVLDYYYVMFVIVVGNCGEEMDVVNYYDFMIQFMILCFLGLGLVIYLWEMFE